MVNNQNPEDINELVSKAKTILALTEPMNFEKIAAHDPEEINKLNNAVKNLNNETNGTQDTPHQQQTTTTINAAGMNGRLGNYFNGYKNTIEPLNKISNLYGLPKFDACIAPDYSPTQSNHCIFVTDSGIISAIITKPIKNNEWRILKSAPYSTNEEMIKLIMKYISKSNMDA